jgi:hypothetical protein
VLKGGGWYSDLYAKRKEKPGDKKETAGDAPKSEAKQAGKTKDKDKSKGKEAGKNRSKSKGSPKAAA